MLFGAAVRRYDHRGVNAFGPVEAGKIGP